MKIKELKERLDILTKEVEGCQNMIEFYQKKKERLFEEYKKLLETDLELDI